MVDIDENEVKRIKVDAQTLYIELLTVVNKSKGDAAVVGLAIESLVKTIDRQAFDGFTDILVQRLKEKKFRILPIAGEA